MPCSFAETAEGLILIANGVDPVLRWDALDSQADTAGVRPPTVAPSLAGAGLGGIVGTYYGYLRFVDHQGNFSNLSPIAGPLTAASTTGAITAATNAAPIQITSAGHGLSTGATVYIQDVAGNGGANGTWPITVVDADDFTLDGSAGTADYLGAGTWSAGIASITYAGVQAPGEAKVARRQLLRNTNGQTSVFYVDVDTDDLTSSSFTSTLLDEALANTGQSQALFDENSRPLSDLNTVPPSHKALLAQHLSRLFLAGEVTYSQGSASVMFGSTLVQGAGTEWEDTFVGRYFYVVGGTQGYLIDAVDTVNQVLTLDGPCLEAGNPFATYAIRPAPVERRLVYYSEAGLPESWPAFNALSLQEDDDEITGLMAKGSFLYILERDHIYRFTFQSDPALDGYVFLAANRGCVNNRCWVLVEDIAYMLDESGAHAFDGGGSEPLSVAIQDLFEAQALSPSDLRINWAASDYFHAINYPGQQTVRWFVALSGSYLPRHALCYDYRLKRWWIEELSFNVGASCLGRLNGRPVPFLGSSSGRLFAYGLGSLDGPSPQDGTVTGMVTASTPTSFTDANAVFPASGVIGSPVVIVAGRGKGQRRTVATVTAGRVDLTQPWGIQPDVTSVYQLGGVQWLFRTGWFRFAEGDNEQPRRLEVTFEPCALPASFDARLYLDRSKSPLLWDTDYSSLDGNGFASLAGQPDLTGDLTKSIGFLQKRLDGRRELYIDGPRYVQLEMSGASNGGPIAFHQITFDGVVAPAQLGGG